MKIVHACNRYYPYFGGAESHIRTVSERMVKKGHEVMVYTTDQSGRLPIYECINGVNVYRFKTFAPNQAYYFSPELFRALQIVTCDIIHGHDLHGFPFLSSTRSKGSKGRIVTLHVAGSSSYFRNLLRLPYDCVLMHYLLKSVDKIICVSDYELKAYPKITNLPLNKFIHMPNGTDLTYLNLQSQKKGSRFILSVGRLEKFKGFQYLIQSFRILCSEKEFDDVSLIIVGKGPYKSNLVRLANELTISNRITMLEDVSEEKLRILYGACNLFAFLSEYESHSIAVLDALAMHKPVITTTGGGLGEYVRKGYCFGVEWPPNPEKVALLMKNILQNPESKRAYIQVLTWNDVTERLLSLYANVLSVERRSS